MAKLTGYERELPPCPYCGVKGYDHSLPVHRPECEEKELAARNKPTPLQDGLSNE